MLLSVKPQQRNLQRTLQSARAPRRVNLRLKMTNAAETSPRKRAVTLKDVAARAGVDKGSASVVVNGTKSNTWISEAKRERIETAARELGYVPNALAQRLANGYASLHIDLCALKLDGGLGVEKIKRIQSGLMDAGYDVPLHSYDFYNHKEGEAQRKLELIQALRRGRPRAIVCATPGVDEAVYGELESYIKEGGHVVCYDDEAPIICDNVVFDARDTVRQAAQHLIELGHQRLGLFVQGNLQPNGSILQGFEEALQKANLPIEPRALFGSARPGEEGGAELAAQFLALSPALRPTGMCVVNDRSAWAFMVELGRAGVRVPDDLSIVGHDNLPAARFCPVPLTSVSHPFESIADEVVRLLLSRLDGWQGAPRRVTITGELVQRASTGAPTSQ